MRVKVVGQRSARKIKVPSKTTVAELLSKFENDRETVVVRVNGRIIPEEEKLADGDLVEILPIITGG